MELESWLARIGLTTSEVKVYLALMRLGSTTTGPLIDESGVSRSKIYHVLERLIRKGIVTVMVKAKTKQYNPADPGKFRTYLDSQHDAFEQLEKDANTLIPEIETALRLAGVREEAEMYKGLEGVKAARDLSLKVLKKGETIYVFGSDKVAQDAMPAYWAEYHKRRARKGIRGKYLMKEYSRPYLDKVKRKGGLIDIRYIDVKGPVYIDIFADYVITTIMVPGYYMAFLVKNRYVADYYKEWFEKLWSEAHT